MIYTALANRAMRIACEAHTGQVDKCGTPYVFHPYHLAEQVPDEITTCVALLHDVAEDAAITLDGLEHRSAAAADIEAARLTPLAGPVFEEFCSMPDTPLPESTCDLLAREETWI